MPITHVSQYKDRRYTIHYGHFQGKRSSAGDKVTPFQKYCVYCSVVGSPSAIPYILQYSISGKQNNC